MARLEELLVQRHIQDFSELAYNEKKEYSFEDKKFLQIADKSVAKKNGHQYLVRFSLNKQQYLILNVDAR